MNEFKIKNGLLVDQGPTVLSGSLTVLGSTEIVSSLTVTQGITGSLFGTASYALDIPKDATVVSGSANAVQSSGVFDALALKVNSSTATTGSVISFDTAKIYNTFTTPTTDDITDDLTGAKIGVVQKIYSNKAVEPTYPLGWVKIGGDYTTSVVNIIYAEWSEGSRVEYWIIKG